MTMIKSTMMVVMMVGILGLINMIHIGMSCMNQTCLMKI